MKKTANSSSSPSVEPASSNPENATPRSYTDGAITQATQFVLNRPLDIVYEDAELIHCRAFAAGSDGKQTSLLVVRPKSDALDIATFERLQNEYRLRDRLKGHWAIRPIEMQRQSDRAVLLLEDTGGEPLEQLLTVPLSGEWFLKLAISTAAAVAQMHAENIVHRDLKPAHLYVDKANNTVRLTGFGIASDIPHRNSPAAPAGSVTGTMAYMSPEQTGRLSRSVDARSDLYSLGVIFYRMLTGKLPFVANGPTEWILGHTSRKPIAPHVRSSSVAFQLSAIVLKLLEKAPEDRYQSAAGLESDLQRCMKDWAKQGAICPFELGEADLPDRFRGPSRLYGRETEAERLVEAFERTLRGDAPELILVSGYSGVGKSSVVHELQRTLSVSQVTFAAGKCDQQNGEMPYAALALALKQLVMPLLTKHDDVLTNWRDAIREAVEPNGRLITELVPELTLVLGDQPPAPELPSQQAQSRFQLVLRRFIQVFARENTPLVLFIDDLQWADAATLELLGDIVGHPDMRHILLVGAYRDNEVNESHPLALKIVAVKATGATIEEIKLAPLEAEQVVSLVSDILRSNNKLVEPLANVVHTKTAGNPFFTIQFLRTLAEEHVLVLDKAAGRWQWDLRPIQSASYTENVANLMTARLQRLPHDCREVLRELACLGNGATAQSLALVRQSSKNAIHSKLRSAVQLELVERVGNTYRFSHDRVQEAAYALTPESARVKTHLTIARFLSSALSDENDDGLFEIAGQYNRALSGITSDDERAAVAKINLRAGIRAKLSAAYEGALRYLNAGAAILGQNQRDRDSDIRFQLEVELAECEFLTGKLLAAELRLTTLSTGLYRLVDRGKVAVMRMDVYTALDRSNRAISVALEFLGYVGIPCCAHPSDDEVEDEYSELQRRVAGLAVADIVKLPPMTDSVALTTVEVLTRVLSAACFTDFNLNSLITCKAINLSLANGNSEASCVAYATLSRIAGPRFGDFEIGIRFGQAGYAIAELNTQHRFHASTCIVFVIFTMHWTQHVRLSEPILRRAFVAANKAGDLLYASYSLCSLNTNLLFAGEALQSVQAEAEDGLIFAQKARHGLATSIISTQLAFVRSMQGQTRLFGLFDDEHFDEREFELQLAGSTGLAVAECWYWTRKMQARYLSGDYATATNSLTKAQALIWTSSMFLEEAEFHFYAALTLAANIENGSVEERKDRIDWLSRLSHHHARLGILATNFPENFANRAALVGAEVARLEGRVLEAERLYERAIQSARSHGFPHQEALASELAARFYRSRGFELISDAYLRNARYGYLRWGALGKVRQIDEIYPHVGVSGHTNHPSDTMSSNAAGFDSDMLIDVSQRVSSEIVFEKVIDTFMQAALPYSGADRALLILSSARGGAKIEADATVHEETVSVEQVSTAIDSSQIPMAVVNYVLRTEETVLISDTAIDQLFGSDPYIDAHRVRAVLCIPLLRRGELTGALYLENKVTPGVFAPPRVAALKLLASQVAIALENARLYKELSDREARIRRLVDANIIGIFIFVLDGTLLNANAAFLNLLGYSRDELERGQLNWRNLTPEDWLQRDLQLYEPQLRESGVLPPFEKEYFRKDGSRAPVLLGAAMFSPGGEEGVGFVVDLTESKRAEAEARETEIRYREAQRELAHANRVSTVGQLTATISHEVKQPIAAMAANADAALRWLSAQPANTERACKALDLIVRDAMRASDIVDRIRRLVRKSPTREERVDINSAILDVLFMIRRDAEKHGIRIETDFASPPPLVSGDRIQLQQVVLNLVANAIEAMSAVNEGRRKLRINTSTDEYGEVEMKVSDTGPGVSAANMDRLFEPFFTTKETGMGIGLSVVHSIVRAHGGRLRVLSDQTAGTTFLVRLPAASGLSRLQP
ncbi:AAA family ATPase [Paraburkholderia sp. BR10937]|uniref:trifunctional serine/threonine-protein kinase/ATP-binding protein/sensor histidine kinase n=1 Tax=Paraburkholderia sp. BR10937 TaxID=3236994 RepID=UPI0034D1B4CA